MGSCFSPWGPQPPPYYLSSYYDYSHCPRLGLPHSVSPAALEGRTPASSHSHYSDHSPPPLPPSAVAGDRRLRSRESPAADQGSAGTRGDDGDCCDGSRGRGLLVGWGSNRESSEEQRPHPTRPHPASSWRVGSCGIRDWVVALTRDRDPVHPRLNSRGPAHTHSQSSVSFASPQPYYHFHWA